MTDLPSGPSTRTKDSSITNPSNHGLAAGHDLRPGDFLDLIDIGQQRAGTAPGAENDSLATRLYRDLQSSEWRQKPKHLAAADMVLARIDAPPRPEQDAATKPAGNDLEQLQRILDQRNNNYRSSPAPAELVVKPPSQNIAAPQPKRTNQSEHQRVSPPPPRREIVITPPEVRTVKPKPTETTLKQKRDAFRQELMASGKRHYNTEDYLEAKAKADELKLPLVLDISMPNCPHCIRLDRTVMQPMENNLVGQAVFLHINVETAAKNVKGGMPAIAKALNNFKMGNGGTPHVVVFDDSGKTVFNEHGLGSSPAEIAQYKNKLRKAINGS